jgi:hypothetical protein
MNQRIFVQWVSFVIIFLQVGCSGSSSQSTDNQPTDYSQFVGWIHGNCIALNNATVVDGSKLLLIGLDSVTTTTMSSISKIATPDDSCYALYAERGAFNDDDQTFFYKVETDQGNDLMIGILVDQLASENYLDLNNDGTEETFTYCFTSEGVNFTVASETDTLWTAYYYLGYEVQPDCP